MDGFQQLAQFIITVLEKDIFLKDIIIILFSVKIMGLFSIKLGQPALFGKLLVGIILGPSLLGILDLTPIIKKLAETGVILLMFLAGLETDISVFKNNLLKSLLVAIGGIVLPLIGGLGFALLWGYQLSTALFIGVILVATSVSISVETLREMGRLKSLEGSIILGAAVIDDILGLITLSIVLNYALYNNQTIALQMLFFKICIFFLFIFLVGYLFMPRVLNILSTGLGAIGKVTLALIISFTFALIAEYLGLAGIVGAYLAGIFLSQTKFANQKLFENIELLGHSFFFPIFFVSIGITAEMNGMQGSLLFFTIIMTFIAILTKIIGSGSCAMLAGINTKSAFGIGTGMVSRGEVALIVANIGLQSGLITNNIYTSMVIITIITTLLTPVLIKRVFML